ncbi:hypothetical protein ESZ00_13925 [Silvibacterium dinghuense]|uniref:Flagellar protein FlgJ N-terminal domain-containing protein n=2 Tax=Silvibacterium dinghuense TaxID=1560006 RepID=A0A4V1NVG1_9BACT|nr:hypothetical protein [Silvibacterium dinghuense]RXS95650.1 hypothetical protein ESZ00_13925 [Silvibacterium dinghuense]
MAANGMASALDPAKQEKLRSAAHEFESSLMQEFLKPLQKDPLFSNDVDGQDDDEEEGSESTLMSLGSEIFGKALSEHGGFGIATKILSQLGASDTSPEVASDSANLKMGNMGGKAAPNY